MPKDFSIEEEIRQCEALRVKLKELGLGYYLKTASEEERSYARRRFREALESHIEKLKQGGQHGSDSGKPER